MADLLVTTVKLPPQEVVLCEKLQEVTRQTKSDILRRGLLVLAGEYGIEPPSYIMPFIQRKKRRVYDD